MHTVLALSGPQFPISFSAGVSCDGNDAPDAEDVIEGYSRLLRENTAIIEQTPIATVLPSLVDSASGGDALASCPATFQGRVTAGVGFTTLTSFDMDTTDAPSASTVVSDPGVVYASESSLYVAVPQSSDDGYGWYSGYEQTPQLSAVHRFALGTDGASSYVASGAVKGKVLNQFSMDEHEGHLRIATVYDVTVADGFALRGKLDFATEEQPADPYGEGAASCSSWWSQASSVVRRSVIMDDFVYGITDSRIQVSALEQVSHALASVDLPDMTQP